MFILYDDHGLFMEKSKNIICDVGNSIKEESIKCFSKFTEDFEQVIQDRSCKKIYVLDIEVPGSISGIEVAKKIRKSDWDSIIIMVTSHTELGYEALKAQIMLLDFISKHNDWENHLRSALTKAVSLLDNKNVIILDSNGLTYRVHTTDIVYILKDSKERKCTIRTINDRIMVSKSMADLAKRLDRRFFQSHRSCYVNIEQITKIDWRNGIIQFRTGDEVDYLARDKKKELKMYVRNK